MTTWTLSATDTKYYQPSTKEFMLNLVVDDLETLLTDLRSKGANVLERGEESEYGKFGYVLDPESTLIELWEPPVST
jgi:predicted enzyme related to lactoylglutathione lyase